MPSDKQVDGPGIFAHLTENHMTLRYTFLPVAFAFFCAAAGAQAPNDECVTALPITCGETLSGSTSNALPDEANNCGTTIGAPGVWYHLIGSGAQVTATTCPDNSYDTKLNVYVGSCGTITCIAGNDDIMGGVLCSSVTFVAVAGESYYLLVQGYNGAVGDFDLALTCEALTSDVCDGALPAACGQTVSGTTVGASADAAPECGTALTAPGVWYSFEGINGQINLTTCPDNTYDTKLNVYTGPCGALVCVAGNDDIANGVLCSSVTFSATAGTTYYVLVQGYDGETGNFDLAITCVTCGTPQSVTATPLDVSATITWSSPNASAQFMIEYGTAGFTPGSGTMITGTYGVDGPPVTISGLTISTNYEYYITEDCGGGDVGATTGAFAFTTLAAPPAVNAYCGDALPITCGGSLTGNTTQGVYTNVPTCGAANVTTNGLWYTFTGTGDDATVSTCAANSFDTKISVFTGACNALVCAGGSDDAPGCPGNTSSVTIHTVAGTTYLVMVHGYDQSQGNFTLTLTCTTPCTPVENDDCTGATQLAVANTGGCESSEGTTICAFAPTVSNPPCDPYGNIVDTWYSFNSGWAANLSLTIDLLGAPVINAAVYTACGDPAYIECWNAVDAPIDLSALLQNTDYLLRIWNGGGAVAGTFSICVEGDFNLGLQMPEDAGAVHLFPVPARDLLTVQPLVGIATLTVVDLQGRVITTSPINSARSATIDVSTLSTGSYILLGDRHVLGRFVRE